MAFQRSYSKVWWGSDYNQSTSATPAPVNVSTNSTDFGCYTSNYLRTMQQRTQYHQQQQQQQQKQEYYSLDYQNVRGYTGNLSRIQEVDDVQNMSKLSWEKRHSPGSLRSQDSGFSDNDDSQNTRYKTTSSPNNNKSNLSENSADDGSPTNTPSSHIATPPTVIRRVGKSQFYSPLVSVSRRISFTGSTKENNDKDNTNTLNVTNLTDSEVEDVETTDIQQKQKRRRRISRQFNKPVSPNRSALSSLNKSQNEQKQEECEESLQVPEYNNETVYLGVDSSFLNKLIAQTNDEATLSCFAGSVNTSTPKKTTESLLFENPLLNGHTPALQHWLFELRGEAEPEVMSTLQTKSIAQQAFKNLSLTTNTVVKLIRQLQQRGAYLQTDFERLERILNGEHAATLFTAFKSATELIENVHEFSLVLGRRAVFFSNTREQRRRFDDQLDQIRLLIKDTRYSLEKQHYMNVESLLDDVQIIYRSLESVILMLYERMVQVIVQHIENSRCDLMLRANINMIATLANIDYVGLGSLTEAFLQNETVRTLLLICLDHQVSSVRALALRALAMICSNRAAIDQLSVCGGIEVIRDILQTTNTMVKRNDLERREAVSLLTQITASWHGTDHYVEGLKDCIETFAEGLTQLVHETNCAQTLLLCAAALNNLSRMEITSHYSIMSNETISKLMGTVEKKSDFVSVFLYEQIVAMLLNMSLNKKCHNHLANGNIINFITCAYETVFYQQYNSRAETEAQRRCVKAILHTLSRLVYDSNVLGVSIPLPHFFRVANSTNSNSSSYNQTLFTHKSNTITETNHDATADADALVNSNGMSDVSKLNLTRCESYV